MAPEYAMQGLFSVKSDVFSFGVLVLETICGRKTMDSICQNMMKLFFYTKIFGVDGPNAGKSFKASEVEKCIHIALLCVQENATDRLTLPKPKHPAFSVGRKFSEEVCMLASKSVAGYDWCRCGGGK
ncbi:hypothetical protein V8G54_024675 [Vigna mungo]|uniref:Protein kinase domain-containing protein n=1 Tax=Vigna mungo TaxID=3915 RepID=A0AAQ3N6B7_VIGMU